MFSIQDREFMARAIRLARKGLYTTDPNPRVGCVIVNNELVVGEGWHEFAGGPHAEVNALRVAGELARGGTAYVTLEPCSHFGKTPPCADALIEAGVSKVIAAMQDPNPQVAGQGFERLRAAGIEVLSGLLEQEAEALNPGFVKRMRTGLPLVRIKLAMSVDGRTAMRSGESQWITGADAREDVQRLRARSSAIVTGSGTVLHDDPSLTVRSDSLQATGNVAGRGLRQPLRVILDSDCQMDPKAKVLTQDGACVIATAHGAYIPDELASIEGLSVVPFSVQETQYGTGIDLNQLLHWLGKQNCNEVLVEAGARLCGQFVQQKLVDELWVYMAPVLMGSEARPLLELPLQSMADRLCLSLRDMRMLGSDIRMIYSPDHSGQQAEPAQTVVAKES